jgi:hypothetical protein
MSFRPFVYWELRHFERIDASVVNRISFLMGAAAGVSTASGVGTRERRPTNL